MRAQETVQGRGILAWLALACLVGQLAFVPYLGIAQGRANLALVFAGVVSLLMGGRAAVVCGFLAGLVFDLSTTGPMGLMSLLLTLCSYSLGRESRNRLNETLVKVLSSFSGHAALVIAAYHVALPIAGIEVQPVPLVIGRMLPSLLLTLIAFVPAALVVRSVSGSGPALQRGSLGGIGKAHLDLGDS